VKLSRAIAISLVSASVLLSAYSAFAAKVGTVSGDSVPLYDDPDKGSNSSVSLLNGDVVTISNYPTKGFYKARTENGQIGWIDSSSLLVGEATQGSDVDAPSVAASKGQSTPANPGAAQVTSPPANQNPQSADNLTPAPPSTPAPDAQPKEEISEVPEGAIPPPPSTGAAQNPPPLPTITPAVQAPPVAPVVAPPAAIPLAPPVPVAPAQNVAAPPVHDLGSSTFTYEDVEPGVTYELENHKNGPKPVEHHYSGKKPYTFSAFVGGDFVSMTDMNALLGGSIFTSTTYFGGEFGYALTDEVKVIGRVEYLSKSSNGGTANLNISSAPVSVGVGFQIGRWKYVHFYASGLVGVGFNTQITANQATLSENTFTEMVKFDADIPVYKSVGAFVEGGYRFLKTSSLTPPSPSVNGAAIFSNNGTFTPTALDLSGPFVGAGLSVQF
jgi:hypothetical protein